MLSTLSEKKMHAVRWVLFLAWCLLIVSLFYDPISAVLTGPANDGRWMADGNITKSLDPTQCISAQGYCIPLAPYAIGLRVFWGMVVPGAIFVVLVFGHEFWRRICPLYFFSQLPRALGMKPLLAIDQNRWLQQNHFYVQFVLFYLGITARILLINSVRPAAGVFFILTLLSAAGVVALYGGRSWCHYVCPFGMVQTVFTGPRGLLTSQAHTAKPYSVTQSMCRTTCASVDQSANEPIEQSACVSCKSSCMDIDSEHAYWANLRKPGRKLVQYGYLGLVIGYFSYYWLYSGNFDYYFSGVWTYEARTIPALFDPGFYVLGRAIAIPKLVAAPLTLAVFAAASCWLCTRIERYYRGVLKQKGSIDAADKSLHRLFSMCTFIAFNVFFIYGGRPEVNRWPIAAQFGFQAAIAILSSLWLYRTWGRSAEQYEKESTASKLRRQLKKMPIGISALLDGRSIDRLNPHELTVLAAVLPPLLEKEQSARNQTEKSQAKSDQLPLPKTMKLRKNTPVQQQPAGIDPSISSTSLRTR